jgi:inorganic pyrophosphatase
MADLARLPSFSEADTFHVVVECPRGSAIKLKWDAALGAMSVSRPLGLGLVFPFDWGFVPSTSGPDGDPVDAIVLWDVASAPGIVVPCRALALLTADQKGVRGGRIRNDRVLAVPIAARREADARSEWLLSPRVRAELEEFLCASTALEDKDLKILGWQDTDAALALIRASQSTP